MFVIKNALKSISRTKGRNILVGIIIVVIAVSSCIALSIKQAANESMENGLANVKVTATVGIDREAAMKNAGISAQSEEGPVSVATFVAPEEMALEDQKALAKLPSVDNFYYTETISLSSVDKTTVKPYSSSDSALNKSTAAAAEEEKLEAEAKAAQEKYEAEKAAYDAEQQAAAQKAIDDANAAAKSAQEAATTAQQQLAQAQAAQNGGRHPGQAGGTTETVTQGPGGGQTHSYSQQSSGGPRPEAPAGYARPQGKFEIKGLGGDFSIVGYSSEAALTKFQSGAESIKSGTVFGFDSAINADGAIEAVISSDLATFNSLNVDDTFQVKNPNNEAELFTLKVVGIYNYEADTTTSSKTSLGSVATAADPANAIYINGLALDDIVAKSNETAVDYASTGLGGGTTTESSALVPTDASTFVFTGRDAYEKFKDAAAGVDSVSKPGEKALGTAYVVSSTDVDNFEKSLVPLQNLDKFATTLLLIILLIGAIIMIILTLFNIRERKYEVGVLTAMGIKKKKVASQFAFEFLFVTLLATLIGAGIGAAASVPVADSLLESQVQTSQAEQATQATNMGRAQMVVFGQDEATSVNYIDSISATVDLQVLAELIGIGLLLTLISSGIGILFVARYEPLQILADRN
jgi:putative ABC transport system permease protein